MCRSHLLGSSEKGKLQPFPVAVHFLEPDITQPFELNLYTGQLIRRVFIGLSDAERTEKPRV